MNAAPKISRDAAWSRCKSAARARDGYRCVAQFQRIMHGGKKPDWERCGIRSGHLAHIYPRRECGKAWAHVEVVAYICERCHLSLHAYDVRVRFDPVDVRRAKTHLQHEYIAGRLKVLPKGIVA